MGVYLALELLTFGLLALRHVEAACLVAILWALWTGYWLGADHE